MTSIEPHTFHSKGPALSAVIATSSTWERVVVPIDPSARLAFATVTGLLAVVTVGQHLVVHELPVAESPGFFMFGWPWAEALILGMASFAPVYLATSVALLASGALTQGFAVAGRRLQIGLVALACAGGVALLPPIGLLLIAAANLVAWVVVIALAITAGVLLLWGLMAAAFDS